MSNLDNEKAEDARKLSHLLADLKDRAYILDLKLANEHFPLDDAERCKSLWIEHCLKDETYFEHTRKQAIVTGLKQEEARKNLLIAVTRIIADPGDIINYKDAYAAFDEVLHTSGLSLSPIMQIHHIETKNVMRKSKYPVVIGLSNQATFTETKLTVAEKKQKRLDRLMKVLTFIATIAGSAAVTFLIMEKI